jgi:glycosyltransferase involved in cell wall biosynthesis
MVREWRLQNFHFLEPVPRNCMSTLLSQAQAVMYLTYAGKVHGVYDLPNKIFEYMGSGKPLVYSGRGTIAGIIDEAQNGLVTPPENSQAFAKAVIYLAEHPEEARAMGLRGREYVMKNFDREKIMAALVHKLESL